MRVYKAADHAFITSIALTALAGCGGGSQIWPQATAHAIRRWEPVRPKASSSKYRLNSFLAMHGGIVPGRGVTTPKFMDPSAAGKPLAFVANGGTINIYLQRGKNKMVGQITCERIRSRD